MVERKTTTQREGVVETITHHGGDPYEVVANSEAVSETDGMGVDGGEEGSS